MWKHWRWLGAGLIALVILGLVTSVPLLEAKPKPKPDPDPGPIMDSPEPGVLLTWVDPDSLHDYASAGFLDSNENIVVAGSSYGPFHKNRSSIMA